MSDDERFTGAELAAIREQAEREAAQMWIDQQLYGFSAAYQGRRVDPRLIAPFDPEIGVTTDCPGGW